MSADVVALIGLIVAFIALVVSIFQAVYPMIQSKNAATVLKNQLKNGPYDDATIERSTYCYINPRCSNIDPAQEQEIRHALMATSEDLFKKVDYFLDEDKSRKHLLILADSGMGKTSFVLNYYVYRFKKRKNRNIRIIPLGNPNPEESLLKDENKREKIVFLDALDEDTKAIANHTERIKELMHLCRDYKKVIVTCRTQFFPKDEEIPIETGVLKIGPKHLGEGVTYEFWKLYLSPLNDQEVKKYIRKRFPWWKQSLRRKSFEMIIKIPLLSIRPMLLAYIPELLDKGREFKYSYEIYEEMVNAWIIREEFWVNKEQLREFSYMIAKDIYIQRIDRGSETISPLEIDSLTRTWNIELERWQITGRSLLNRDATGNYKFAHRSIMEYLFVYQLFQGDTSCYRIYLTDQMRRFFFDMINKRFISSYTKDNILQLQSIPGFCYELEVIVDNIVKVSSKKNYFGSGFFVWIKHIFNEEEDLVENSNNINWILMSKKMVKQVINKNKRINIYNYFSSGIEEFVEQDICVRNRNDVIEVYKNSDVIIDSVDFYDKVVFLIYHFENNYYDKMNRNYIYEIILCDVYSNISLMIRSNKLIYFLDKYGINSLFDLYEFDEHRGYFEIRFDDNSDELSLIISYNKKEMDSYLTLKI